MPGVGQYGVRATFWRPDLSCVSWLETDEKRAVILWKGEFCGQLPPATCTSKHLLQQPMRLPSCRDWRRVKTDAHMALKMPRVHPRIASNNNHNLAFRRLSGRSRHRCSRRVLSSCLMGHTSLRLAIDTFAVRAVLMQGCGDVVIW